MSNNNIEYTNSSFPADLTAPEGMQVLFAKFPGNYASYKPNIEYATYEDRSLKLQLITPEGNGPFPLIVFIQGSAFFAQNLYGNIPQLSYFARRGYVVASVEYRHSIEAKFPAQIQDVKTAIRFLRANAEEYKINPERVAVWGDSSGGMLASMVGVSEGVSDFATEHYPEQSDAVQAVVNYYGPSDMLQMNNYPTASNHDAPDSPASIVIGGPIQENKEKTQLANPIHYIKDDKQLPPFIIFHGDKDSVVPFNQSVLLYEALRDNRHQATFYKVKGAGHGNGMWHDEILHLIQSFLQAHV